MENMRTGLIIFMCFGITLLSKGARGRKHMFTTPTTTKPVPYLLDRLDVSDAVVTYAKSGKGLLLEALKEDDFVRVRNLLKSGSNNGSAIDPKGYYPIHYATAWGSTYSLIQLLKVGGGVDISARSEPNRLTPLHIAVMRNFSELVDLLIHNGADLNAQDASHGFTPLHLALLGYELRSPIPPIIIEEEEEVPNCDKVSIIAKDLIESGGADLNIRDRDRNATLHSAILARCDLELIKGLVGSGADLYSTNRFHEIPLHLSQVDGPTYKYLLDQIWSRRNEIKKKGNADGYTNWYEQLKYDNLTEAHRASPSPAIIKTLVDSQDLHRAAGASNFQAVKFYVEHGADLDAREGYCGYTPLYYAAEGGDLAVVSLLVENGASLEVEDYCSGRTPLDSAIFAQSWSDNFKVIKYLRMKIIHLQQAQSNFSSTTTAPPSSPSVGID